MASERVQRRIEGLLDEADESVYQLDWGVVRDRASPVLGLDLETLKSPAYLAADRGA